MILKSLLIFIFFISLSYSQINPSCRTGENWIIDFIRCEVGEIIPLLILLSIFLISLFYSLGTAFNKIEWKLWAQDEFFHLIVSIVLLFSLVGIIHFFNLLFVSAFNDALYRAPVVLTTCSSSATIQYFSSCYLEFLTEKSERIIEKYTHYYVDYMREAAQYISYFGFAAGTTVSPYAYKRTWSSVAENALNVFVLPAYLSIKAQKIFVDFFIGRENPSQAAVFTILLPAALILRFFPLLRASGNFLIAFSLALYTILPFLIALNGLAYVSLFSKCNSYSAIIDDALFGNCSVPGNLFEATSIYPQAFLLPNIIIVFLFTFIGSLNKALRALS